MPQTCRLPVAPNSSASASAKTVGAGRPAVATAGTYGSRTPAVRITPEALNTSAAACGGSDAGARVVLAEAASTAEEARLWHERGVEAGARAIGPDGLAAGGFWSRFETRPYMRARLGLAQILDALDRRDEALAHYGELLRLNPGDNQGVRYLLLPALLELGRDDEADRLLAAYKDDIQALWPYARAVRAFRSHGDGDRARAALAHALIVNSHVGRYLVNPDAMPQAAPPHFSLGSAEEGAHVAGALQGAVANTPGALAWLKANSRRPGRTARRGAGRRRR